MSAKFYRFYPALEGDSFAPDVVSLCLLIPGVWARKDGSLEGSLNCAWLLEATLRSAGVAYKWWIPKEPKAAKKVSTIAELIRWKGLRSHDPKTGIAMEDFLAAYQKREPFAHAESTGVLFQWPPGSGKSLGGEIWGLLDDGPIVVVTGAKGRLQWRDSILRFTTWTPYVCAGTQHIKDHELQLIEVAKLEGRKFPPAVRENFEGGKVMCSCETPHRKTVFSRGRKLFARVHLQPGHHVLTYHVGNVTSLPVTVDVDEPIIPDGTKFVVCSWETLPYHIDTILAWKPTTVILDESHRGKNHRRVEMIELSEQEISSEPKAKQLEDGRWIKYVDLENIVSATQKLCKRGKRHGLLTATPIKDRVRDLWAQLDYMVPWGWGKYWDFAKRYCGAHTNPWGGMDDRGMSNMDELVKRVDFHRSYVSSAEANANLPAMRREVIYLSPDDQQREDEGFADELAAAAKAKASVHSIANIRLAAACSRKRKAIIEQIAEEANGGAKVVAFTARHNDVDALRELLPPKLSKNVRFFASDGRDSADKRYELSREYMAIPTHAVFIGTGQAFGEQIDLNETDIAHIVMLPFTVTELIQEEGRFLRKGSTRAVLVNYWVAEGTADERVASILLSKLPAIEKMGTEGSQGMRAAFAGDEEALIAALAKDIMAGGHGQIVGGANVSE